MYISDHKELRMMNKNLADDYGNVATFRAIEQALNKLGAASVGHLLVSQLSECYGLTKKYLEAL